MITYKIYGMHIRDNMINNLKNQLDIDDSNVYYEDRPNGGLALYTAKKAWLSPIEPNETHRCVFPDDTEVCDGFKNICEKIVATHPDAIISLLCWEGLHRNKSLDNLPTPYINSRFVIGCGIIMPIKYINPCFNWIKETYDDNIADDAAIQYWAAQNKIQVITTIPSLVQHLGDNSILTPNMSIRRSVYFSKLPPEVDWTNKEVTTLPSTNNFKPHTKRILKVYG